MKTFIINLKQSSSRRSAVLREVQRCGLDYEFVEAVDGNHLTDADMAANANLKAVAEFPDFLTPRAIATSLSHQRVYAEIVSRKLDMAFVIEDDIAIDIETPKILAEAAPCLRGAEVVLLHCQSFAELGISTVNAETLSDGRTLNYPMFYKGVGSGAAYLITYEAAQNMLRGAFPIWTAADHWGEFLENGILDRVRVIYPFPIQVVGAKSTIYLDNQSRLRGLATSIIDELKIPILFSLFRKRRLSDVEARLKFHLTDEKSPYER